MLEKGLNHLIYEARTNFTYELFAEFLKSGVQGLCITTTLPRKLHKEYGLKNADIIWITDMEGVENALDPKLLNTKIWSRVKAFTEENAECVILIDDLGYIILENGYKEVEKFLAKLDACTNKANCTLMVPLNPDSVTTEISSALSKKFDQVKDVRNYILTGNKVECPECGAMWHTNIDACDICGYQFSAETHKPALVSEEKPIPRREAKVSGKLRVKPPEDEAPQIPVKQAPLAYNFENRPPDDSWFNRGVALEKMGKSEQAIECFDKALEQNPNDSWAWFNKGVSLHRLGLLGEALYCYDKAMTYNPNDPDLLSNKGIALRTLGRTDEALECYKKALNINPGDSGIWSNMGVTYRVMGMNDAALDAYNRALKIDPYDVGVWLNKAAALQSQGKFDEAIQCYEEVLRINPYHPVALRNKEFAMSRTLRS
ncbi:MAG: tetratricopeptide repeat protein [Candidatus Thermoplasmatota archaeon]|nr:tetratricopeptide repeat protein [Euryarchaeota archaeon]MBU4031438.1 tetratricopeptide repeat protein [Candidatus Thermoplasmatota archaeon]MBU4071656.1 tetratricopeptide repeat protein [Candidatus Thermoplasmatota archaeon]MBU4144985.1 tetratricopeptide repeat protein [Candidatus Thermoplasmatota archaeon]MBU4591109.1 tetratricopeptide repeat protein [Candidatus Thermoplasmatota archaeon]